MNSYVPINLVCDLLTESLAAWRIAASVCREGGDVISIFGSHKEIRVEPLATGQLFRWSVTIDGRKRGAISLVSVLRQVREAVDPGYEANRVRVSLSPMVLP